MTMGQWVMGQMDGSRGSRVSTCDPLTQLDLTPVDVVQQEPHRLRRQDIIAAQLSVGQWVIGWVTWVMGHVIH